MSDLHIRPATAADQPLIRQWVRREQLDPTTLQWQNFLMAERAGEVVGFGQVRPYPRCRELGSLVVHPEYRGQHIGEALVQALLAREAGIVYLECEQHNEAFYARFGFRRIPWHAAPPPLRWKNLFGSLLARLAGYHVIAMQRLSFPHDM
jgi:N-acetylglutamate synthase-like GNAT family acetyltransferase